MVFIDLIWVLYGSDMEVVCVWYGGCMGFVSVRNMGLVWVLFGSGVSLVYWLGRGLV